MSDSDILRQLTDAFHNCSDNGEPNAANVLVSAMRDHIENAWGSERSGECETGNNDYAKTN